MEFVNEPSNHPILPQCVFVPFGRCTSIDQPTFCSLIRMQNEFLHNIQHVEIHGLANIDMMVNIFQTQSARYSSKPLMTMVNTYSTESSAL
jgi:hypothetical protein